MSGQELFDLFKDLVDDDSFNETSFYILLNSACAIVETSREWEFLKDDQTYTITGNYSVEYTLPTNFLMPLQFNCLYVNRTPYTMVRPERWEEFYDRSGYFTIKNNKLRISGSGLNGQSVLFNYIGSTTIIDSSGTVAWPDSRFHPILAYKAAILFLYADGVEPSRDKAPQWYGEYLALLSAMENQDSNLKQAYQNTYND
jgi:hypothetical protein